MVKAWHLALALAAALLPLAMRAQTDVSLDPEAGGRISATASKKLAKGLQAGLEGEARLGGNFQSLSRLQLTASVRYKPLPGVKVGAGYSLIAPYSQSSEDFKSPRHRFMADAQYSLRMGAWQLSLKERLQATLRTGDFNHYQQPGTLLGLKSRLMAKYRGLQRLTPYAAVELRHVLNAPAVTALYDGTDYLTPSHTTTGEPGWFLDGFNSCYANRLRGLLGVEYRLDRSSTVDASLMLDWVNDKVVDANAEGTKLKSYTRERGLAAWLCVGYEYSF
ncbi:MAG: DUF2490 domain-containing protein [Bacteroidales bacterium]|nr:DUF2490 domain-containing protein [Bacteroidales bacterium]